MRRTENLGEFSEEAGGDFDDFRVVPGIHKSGGHQRTRRTVAMASLKVRSGLPYQPAVRGRMAAPRLSINPCIQIVTRENSPSSAGVVRAIARSDHWRCVSTPRWARTSWNVVSTRQRETEPAENFGWGGFDVGRQERLRCQLSCGIARQHPADRRGWQAATIPHRHPGNDLDRLAAVPLRQRDRRPDAPWIGQHRGELRRSAPLRRGPPAAASVAAPAPARTGRPGDEDQNMLPDRRREAVAEGGQPGGENRWHQHRTGSGGGATCRHRIRRIELRRQRKSSRSIATNT